MKNARAKRAKILFIIVKYANFWVLVAVVVVVALGESLFTLFASLTYAYHCLMTLIK